MPADTTTVPNGGGAGGRGDSDRASGGNLTVAGLISANAGYGQNGASGGSGGGIRLVANIFSGNGIIQALGGGGDHAGGLGRIRIERVTNNNNSQVNPDPSVLALSAGSAPVIWPPTTGPSAKIISIGNVSAACRSARFCSATLRPRSCPAGSYEHASPR